MCGIAGIVNEPGPAARGCVDRMLLASRHRGPDDVGVYTAARTTFGVRRLSIIDIEHGHQPVANEDGTVHAAMNGTIYSFRSLRAELLAHGHNFRCQCDTEVLVHGYEQWGFEGLLDRLDGMFAFALHDTTSDHMYIARDRMGIKPLYYTERNGALLFASEMAALLASERVPVEPDPDGVRLFLQLRYTPAPWSVLAGVRKLQPAHYLKVTRGRIEPPAPYWSLSGETPSAHNTEDWLTEIRRAVSDAVRSHMIGDVDVGVFLSGGLDSSLVLGLMSRVSERPIRAYSMGFEDPQCDETGAAEATARRFGADLLTCRMDHATIRNTVERLAAGASEPIADPAFLPTLALSQEACRSTKVVQTGEGADELFAGYGYYERWSRPLARARELARGFARTAALRVGLLGPHATSRSPLSGFPYIMPRGETDRYLADFPLQENAETRVSWVETSHLRESGHPLNRALLADASGSLPDNLLAKLDRATMAHGLEARVPFLDRGVVETALRMPAHLKLRDGTGKWVLREGFKNLLGPEIVNQGKRGFNLPMEMWLRGTLREACMDRLGPSANGALPWLDTRATSALLQAHQDGRDLSPRLWTLFALADWFRHVTEKPHALPGSRGATGVAAARSINPATPSSPGP